MKMNEDLIYIDAYWRSLNKYGEELCGDRVQIRRGEKCFVMVLADGLGSGVKANILSTLTSTIISEMIVSGMALADAVETITATLPVCQERGIAYSTFSIVQIFSNGNTYIAEFDGPDVVIMRDDQIYRIAREKMVMNGRQIYVSSMHAEPGDRFVVFSDGVLHAGVGMALNFGWGQKEVEEYLQEQVRRNDTASETTRLLLANVNYLYGGKPGDDSTAVCLRVIPLTETINYRKSCLDPLFYSQISDCRIIYDFLSIPHPEDEHLFFHSAGDADIASLFRFLLQELSLEDSYTGKNVSLFTVALLTYLDRKRPEQLLLQNSTMVAENRFGKIMKYIGDHYPTCTLQEVAEKFGYNPSYLSTRFQKITGETFSHKLQSIRLLQAERLLLTTDLTVEQISSQVGFHDKSHFIRNFRDTYGETPSRYRKNHKL